MFNCLEDDEIVLRKAHMMMKMIQNAIGNTDLLQKAATDEDDDTRELARARARMLLDNRMLKFRSNRSFVPEKSIRTSAVSY